MLNQDKETEKGFLKNIFFDKSKSLKATVKALLEEIELLEKS